MKNKYSQQFYSMVRKSICPNYLDKYYQLTMIYTHQLFLKCISSFYCFIVISKYEHSILRALILVTSVSKICNKKDNDDKRQKCKYRYSKAHEQCQVSPIMSYKEICQLLLRFCDFLYNYVI